MIRRPAERDLRIDFFRGIALIEIFVNHIPGNLFEKFSHKNFGITDAAEVFVLLAGVSAAFAYFPAFMNASPFMAIGKVMKRVGTLYIAHLSNIVVGFALFSSFAVWFGTTFLLTEFNLPPMFAQTPAALVGLPLLTYQIGYFNILPIYVALLSMLPAILFLAGVSRHLLLAVSVTLYLGAQIFQFNIPTFPDKGYWFFNPFAWQFIFTAGFLIGERVMRTGKGVPYYAPLFWASLAYLIACGSYAYFNMWGTLPALPLPLTMVGNDKSYVSFPRLAHLLALAYVIGHSPLMGWLKRWLTPQNMLVLIGRNSLPVFWTGTLLSVIGLQIRFIYNGYDAKTPMPEQPSIFWLDLILVLTGILVQYGVAVLMDRLGRKQPARQPAAASTSTLAASPGTVAE
ncbi:OpgC protein [Hartmannibacter diazotrophicus]|uniref:OpgC protein n=1 Tax=Hartmannibacter diazotrophicus TaxID=1482074 RepID=A0A2C9DAE1_9HYPH|nr:OpgC domain-containing protein [Hartmannibacter diazotrophicus]SON57203.1 OpgC protein [Hartmannibacter diazotrophicus]